MLMTKILLIDDDPDIRQSTSAVLRRQGYDVVTASHREEALQRLTDEEPSIILLDVLLSGADGRELCREIKADVATSHIPVIMFSGHPGAASGFESYGADDFLAKPFTAEELLRRLSSRLDAVK